MIQQVLQAIAQGFPANTVLQSLATHYPKYKKLIAKAQATGFAAPAILKKLVDPNGDASDYGEYLTEDERGLAANKNQRRKERIGLAKGIGTVASLGLGAYGLLSKGAQATANAASVANAGVAGGGNPPPGGGGGGGPPTNPPGGGTGGGAAGQGPLTAQTVSPQRQGLFQTAQNLPNAQGQTNQTTTPSTTPTATISSIETSFPHLPKLSEKLLQAGKSPEEVYQTLLSSKSHAPIVKKYEEKEGRSYLERIKEMGGGKSSEAGHAPKVAEKDPVITPFGSGTVHKIHGDNAYVETQGKLKKVPLSEIEEPPENAAKAVSEWLNIPEEDRSSNVALFVYDPDEKKALFQFHDGNVYKYLDFPPELVEEIAAKNAIPITKGENEYGVWSPEDKQSLGAALWAYVLKDPKWKKAGKGEEANPNYKKLITKYDYWEKLRKRKK